MRKMLFAAVILLATQSGWAGVQYEFIQTAQSDIEQFPPTRLTGRAVIDGDRSRVDFIGGNIYAPGAYVVSTDGSRTMAFVDPVSKSYSEINASAVAVAYGSGSVSVKDVKTDLQKLPDQTVVAGIPTSHYHLTITYDVTLMYGSMPIVQSVREDIEKWTTDQFGEVADNFFAGGTVRTGNAELDKVIDAETKMVPGFPLRQRTTITTTNPRGKAPGSQLALSQSRSETRDLQIQSIHKMTPDATLFSIPVSFTRVDPSQQAKLNKKPEVTVLSFDTPQPK